MNRRFKEDIKKTEELNRLFSQEYNKKVKKTEEDLCKGFKEVLEDRNKVLKEWSKEWSKDIKECRKIIKECREDLKDCREDLKENVEWQNGGR